MSYPRFHRARAHKLIKRATGTAMVLNSTAIAELAAATNGPGTGGFDITLEAQVGDVLEWGFNGLVESAATNIGFDIYTMIAGTRTNPFGAGLSASLASTVGVRGWYTASGLSGYVLGAALYVVQAGDIASGAVTCRPYYAEGSATARTLDTDANTGLQMWLKNLGPVSA